MSDFEALPRPERKATKRLGQRELSRISLGVVLLVVLGLVLGGIRVFSNFKSQRDIVMAQTNLLKLWQAMRGYSEDWESRLPPAELWTDSIAGFLSAPPNTPGGALSYLHGPGEGETVGYVYNDLLTGYDLQPTGRVGEDDQPAKKHPLADVNPKNIVVFIEQPGAPPNAHAPIPPLSNSQAEEALGKQLSFPHFSGDEKNATTMVLFADGSIRRMLRQDFAK